ncbi:MAG: 50S ribosomal protein L21e [Candidatus Hodarchaeota archaeon]
MTIHKGYRNKSRKKHRKKAREKGLGSIEKYLVEYEIGNKVDIITDSSKHKRGMPHRRFHGLTGTILGQRGRCYEVEVRLGKSKKLLIIGREHLRLSKSSIKQN